MNPERYPGRSAITTEMLAAWKARNVEGRNAAGTTYYPSHCEHGVPNGLKCRRCVALETA
jgi:hypothetical protein